MCKWFILCLVIFSSLSFGSQRFTDKDREQFMKETRIDAQEFKAQNQGKFDLQLMKPFIIKGLDELNLNKKFSKAEMVFIKSELEKYMKDSANNSNEEKFYKILDDSLKEISQKALEKIKAGGVCNELQCDANLQCLSDPQQNPDGKSCFVGMKECKIDGDCCSDYCIESKKVGKKLCAPIRRCYPPGKLGESCAKSPACEKGSCLPYNSNTIGIGECTQNNQKCAKNSQCCSNLCDDGVCRVNLICKSCAINGEKVEKGRTCCEGLYKGAGDVCIPDLPPIIPPQVKNEKAKDLFKTFLNIIIPQAYAGDAYNTVNGDRDKFGNFVGKSAEKDKVDMGKATANLGISLKSNFDTCDIHFRQDFYAYLKKNNLFNQEIALLAFDYMLVGEENNYDYWRLSKGNESSSIQGRLQKVARSHEAIRKKFNKDVAVLNNKLTCMCLDIVGVKNLTDPKKADYFSKNCSDYTAASKQDQVNNSCTNLDGESTAYSTSCVPQPVSGMTGDDCTNLKTALDKKKEMCASTNGSDPASSMGVNTNEAVVGGDASSLKAKKLLVFYTAQMSKFNQTITIDNSATYKDIAAVRDWIGSKGAEQLNSTETQKIQLGWFTIDGYGQTAQSIGIAVLGALLSAGVIAILGGFATTSLMSAWTAIGIITATAVASGSGAWMVASLKGAWIAKKPTVTDEFIRTQSCGKKGKNSCTDWRRNLSQPFNSVCDAHISANACVKNFLAYRDPNATSGATSPDSGGFRYIVDPFIPFGIKKAELLRSQGDYALKLEASYQKALANLQAKAPQGQMIGESYMWEDFLDESATGLFAPDLGANPEDNYLLTDNNIAAIKNGAKDYAIKQEFLEANEIENLKNFAEYAYDYHFRWPKTSLDGEISYPTVALDTYLEFMSNGVAASLTAGGVNAAATFGGLNSKYLEDYLGTLTMYKDQAALLSDAQKGALDAEIKNTQTAILNNKLMAAVVNSSTDLNSLNRDSIGNVANRSGLAGATLSNAQMDFAHAIGTYRTLRNNQIKRSDIFKKANASSGTNSDRLSAVSKSMQSFSNKFTSPLTASLSKGSGFNTNADTKNDANTSSGESSSLYKGYKGNSGNSGINSFNINNKSSGSSGRSAGTSSGKTEDTANADGNKSGAADEDSKTIDDAIAARDKANSNKFQSTDENSLFEKVTKAYIRNYDKVLTKKKQEKDIVDKKD